MQNWEDLKKMKVGKSGHGRLVVLVGALSLGISLLGAFLGAIIGLVGILLTIFLRKSMNLKEFILGLLLNLCPGILYIVMVSYYASR